MSTNPYAPPKATVADIEVHEDAPPLWNPNAAANWSLLFSPAFGAFLHMKNWQALGEPAKASAARTWVIVVVSILIALPVLLFVIPAARGLESLSRIAGLILLISWYVSSGRAQAQYVKERLGKDYPRKGWGKPLLIALGAFLGYVLVLGLLGAIVGYLSVATR